MTKRNFFQNESYLDDALRRIPENHVYICLVTGDSSIQVYVAAERLLLGTVKNPMYILISLIGAYFTFNIVYPKPLHAILIFIQHFILNIIDKQKVPDIVTRTIASLDNISH